MALDPNISLGVRQMELANPLAQYGQIAQIQNAQNQNALAQYQLSSAQRADLAQNALSEAYRKSLSPETGAIDSQALIRNLAASNAAHLIPDVQTKLLATEKERGLIKKTGVETAEKELKLRNDKLNFAYNSVGSAATPEMAIQKINEGLKDGFLDFNTASAEIKQLQNLASPDDFQKYRIQKIMGILNEKDKIGFMLPKIRQQEAGGNILGMQDNPMMPGYGMPIAGMTISKTPTFAEQTGQGQLALARAKFAFEQANPNQTIHETPTGFVAVNNRTGMAMPVVYGPNGIVLAAGAAQATTPAASMMRQPPAALPGQRIPAISGMPSVLDQTVPSAIASTVAPAALPVGTPGTPVMGRQAELKPIPANINLAILKNNQAIQQIDSTIKLLQQNPDATGAKGYLPGFALNRMDPEGVDARAGVADIGSLVLHDRSGAAVTAAEAPRLMPFIPLATDDNKTVIKKLTRMRNIAAQEQTGLTETYGKDQGYLPNPAVGKTSGTALSGQQIPPIYATNGKERIVSTDGGQTWTPANK